MINIAKLKQDPNKSLGRIFPEQEDKSLIFLIDRNRIIFSTAFRRLKDKTQVFANRQGDHYRTRLTHSLEVAAISKFIAAKLHLEQDLAETIALAHDLGHPPFGHAGEDGLSGAMSEFGGFDHNFHTLKVIGLLEKGFDSHHGLNLSYETIEGLIKHNGPVDPHGAYAQKINVLFQGTDFHLSKNASLEAQIASIADDIAYCAHDVEDGLRSGFFELDAMTHLGLMKDSDIREPAILASNIRRLMISNLIDNILIQSNHGLLIAFSNEMEQQKNDLKKFLMDNLYRHYSVNRMRYKAKIIMHDLFGLFMTEPNCLPTLWYKKTIDSDRKEQAIVISDYIAGMSDRFAVDEYKRLLNASYLET